MVKFPSQNKLTYQTGNIGYGGYGAITSGSATGILNLPKDLSIVNRRGYQSTKNGVPLIYRTKFDFFLHDEDGAYGPPSVLDNLMVTLKIDGCQNNWVMRNAAVKWHAAREKMFRKAGVKKSHRGAYSDEIRYSYDSSSETWLIPITGGGDAFAGGTWDLSDMSTEDDSSFSLKLVGANADESGASAISTLSIGHAYLNSRAQVPADTNLEASTTPTTHSYLTDLLDDSDISVSVKDDIVAEGRSAQDNPPYQLHDPTVTDSDLCKPVELGRCLSSTQAAVGSCVVNIPFGIAELKARAYTSESTSGVDSVRGLIHAEVVDIFPMQG